MTPTPVDDEEDYSSASVLTRSTDSIMADWSGYADVLSTSESESSEVEEEEEERKGRRRSYFKSPRRGGQAVDDIDDGDDDDRRSRGVKEAAMRLDGFFSAGSGGAGAEQHQIAQTRRVRPSSRWSETDDGMGGHSPPELDPVVTAAATLY
jgi:hypothetical protein